MIRIAHLFDTSGPGGAETVLVTLVRGLDPKRYESFACIRRHSWMHRQLEGAGCGFHFLRNSRALDIGYVSELARFFRRHRIDVAHSHEFFMNVYGAMAAKAAGIPIVATVHGQVDYVTHKMRRRVAYRLISRLGCMVSVSEQVAGRFHEEVGVSKHRIRTIYNGITMDAFQNGERLDGLRSELAISPDAPVIGMVGNLYPVKGYPYFIRAMQLVREEFPSSRFIVCGRGKLQNQLEELASECGLAESMTFLGFRLDVPRLLRLMDVFVMSSLSEGLSLSIMEAMAAGKAVVVTDVGGNREIVLDGETGFIVPAENPPALAQKVSLLLSDPELARRMGQKGRQRVVSLFSQETMVKRYQALYTALTQNESAKE